MRRDTREDNNEEYVRQLNDAAERDAEMSRIKARLWRRISAAMKEIPHMATKGPSHLGTTTPVSSSPKA
ncbi:MAG: hypothetical protein ABSA83_08085 [Verrucomicrobiota bacterium]|jgi:hypothetical protein